MKFFLKGLLLLLLSFLPIHIFAQQGQHGNGPGSGAGEPQGIITGTVLDKKSGTPIEYANIVLYKAKDSTMVNGTISDKKGKFRFEKVPFGKFTLKVNFIGFKLITIKDVIIKPDSPITDIGSVSLETTSTNIEGVTINEQKDQMDFNLDKKVINVDKNLVVAGGTAIDIMQTIPSVQVDVEGTVSLRGSSNVTILIDGRPSTYTSLDQLPASMIERVEIVTNPSARYDPDGMSGIINIVLKKKKEPGYHGLVSLNVGTHDKYMGSVNLNYRYNKINVFANYDLRYFSMNGTTINNRESWYNSDTTYLDQDNDSKRHGNFHNIKAGIDYFINDFNTISFSGSYGPRAFETNDSYQYTERDSSHTLTNYYERVADGSNKSYGYDAVMNYKKTFKQKNREWTIDASYEYNNGNSAQDMRLQYYDVDMIGLGLPDYQESSTLTKGWEGEFRTDYVHPLKKGRIETGYKYNIDYSDQDYSLNNKDSAGINWILDTNTSNRFIYDEQIHAAYLIFSSNIKKFQYQVGVRLEEDLSNANQVTQDIKFFRDRFSWFPSVHLKYEFSDMHALQISYSRRVHRPNSRNLNPFTNYSDPLNLSTGNPYLKPEYINSAELGYDFSYKTINITASVFFRQTTGLITRITTLDSAGVSHTTYDNLNNGTSYGVELIYAHKFFKWWKFNANGSYFRQEYQGDQVSTEARSSYSWNFKINSTWSPLKDFDIQASFNYNSPVVTASGSNDRFFSGGGTGTGKMTENYWADLGMKKDFFKGNLSLSFRISDVFKTQKYNMYSWGENYTTYTERHRDSRIFFLGVTYKINGGIKKKRPDEGDPDMGY
jgi:outer membrane receptor protein involved in Fe transport